RNSSMLCVHSVGRNFVPFHSVARLRTREYFAPPRWSSNWAAIGSSDEIGSTRLRSICQGFIHETCAPPRRHPLSAVVAGAGQGTGLWCTLLRR
ncbi:hypothetical protein PMAYCL1PPCAC_32591, partial [Pristionchus mayeri]